MAIDITSATFPVEDLPLIDILHLPISQMHVQLCIRQSKIVILEYFVSNLSSPSGIILLPAYGLNTLTNS